MHKSLYDIQSEHAAIVQYLLDLEGEITPEIESQLAISEEELENKAESYALRILEFNGQAIAIENEIIRLKARQSQYEKTADKLKENIKAAMIQFNKDKIKTTKVSLSIRKSESVDVPESFTQPILKLINIKAWLDEEKIEQMKQDAFDAGAEPPVIPDASLLEYFNLSATVNKSKIKADLKEGLTISECNIITNRNLQIK